MAEETHEKRKALVSFKAGNSGFGGGETFFKLKFIARFYRSSIENVIPKEQVDKFKLPTKNIHIPAKNCWLKRGCKIPVTSRRLVKFRMRNNLDDKVLSNVLSHIFVRTWLYDHDKEHCTKPNTYSF
ncbi:hypothetical protein ERO13_D03G073264v2, partial [Gossypium hirsutum]|uniref:Uncharacterized protein n=3 Tax=Gossypium TaxID=3633 RepID=A0A5J5S1Z0_GOSBA